MVVHGCEAAKLSSDIRVDDVTWPLMGVSAPVGRQFLVEHGSRTASAAEPVTEDTEDAEEAVEECDGRVKAVVDAAPRCEGGQIQWGYRFVSPATPNGE